MNHGHRPKVLFYEIFERDSLWCSRYLEFEIYKNSSSFFLQFCIVIVTVLIADVTKSTESDGDSESNDNIDDDDTPEELNDSQADTISKDEL